MGPSLDGIRDKTEIVLFDVVMRSEFELSDHVGSMNSEKTLIFSLFFFDLVRNLR